MKYYLGVDLGGTNIAAGVLDENYQFLSKVSAPTGAGRAFEEILDDMIAASKQSLGKAGLSGKDIDYVGIGVPSTLMPDTSEIIFANNLNWRNVDIVGEFRKRWDIPVCIENDADCAALGETISGSAKDYNTALLLTLGTGIGSSIILDKKIFHGGLGVGCEAGHFPLVFGGEQCTCGRKGCFEAYVSVVGLVRDTIKMMAAHPDSVMGRLCDYDMRKVNGRTAFDAARMGDEAGKIVVGNYVAYLADAIGGLINIFHPQIIILGGGISNEGDFLLEPVRKLVWEHSYDTDALGVPPIVKAALGNDAGIIGAAFLRENIS